MVHLKFTVTIPPVPQERPRARAIERKGDNRVMAMAYKSGKQKRNDGQLMHLLVAHKPDVPLEGQIFLGVKAYLRVPPSKSKRWQSDAIAGVIRPTTRPDLDNLIKQLKDCMKNIFWLDDKQVVGYLPGTGKYYGDPVRWEIEIIAQG
jgi:Holliday junction resolvase RusA-like endonuclease